MLNKTNLPGKFTWSSHEHKSVLWPHESRFVQNLIQLHKFTLLQIAFHFLVIWIDLCWLDTNTFNKFFDRRFAFRSFDWSWTLLVQIQSNYFTFPNFFIFHYEEIILRCVSATPICIAMEQNLENNSQLHWTPIDDTALIHINIDIELCLHRHTAELPRQRQGTCWTSLPAPLTHLFRSSFVKTLRLLFFESCSTD